MVKTIANRERESLDLTFKVNNVSLEVDNNPIVDKQSSGITDEQLQEIINE